MTALAHNITDYVFPITLNDQSLECLVEGALWLPDEKALVVSDLHLEKGSSFARRGQMLPPYDTGATLAIVSDLVTRLQPEKVISLGDSFHDDLAERRLSDVDTARIRWLTSLTDWVWVEGNHDPMPPRHLGGRGCHELRLSRVVFRHEPTGEAGEIAGHLHPCAKIKGRGRSVRAKCFATDGVSLVMPAMGTFTGGLNVCDKAFSSIFRRPFSALVMGQERVYAVPRQSLVADGYHGTQWRL